MISEPILPAPRTSTRCMRISVFKYTPLRPSHHAGSLMNASRKTGSVFRSLAVPPENSFAIAPLPPGRYSYYCELHPVMRGTLVVMESQAAKEVSESLAQPGK